MAADDTRATASTSSEVPDEDLTSGYSAASWFKGPLTWRRLLLVGLSSLGLSGALVILGYAIAAAQHEFLGFEIRNASSKEEYLSLGGTMFLDVIIATLDWIDGRPLLILAKTTVVAVILAGSMLLFLAFLRLAQSHYTGLIVIAVMAAILMTDILILDLPANQLRDTLRSDIRLHSDPEGGRWIEKRNHALWLRTICSRLDQENIRRQLKEKGIECNKPAEWYTAKNRDEFLLNAVLALVFLGLAILLVFSIRSGPRFPALNGVLVTLVAFLAVVNLILLSRTYGKIRKPTIFKEAIVRIEETTRSLSEHGFILTDSGEVIVLFHKRERQIWFIPRERVSLVKVERHEDVLTHYFTDLLRREQQGEPPPPL